MLEKVVLAIAIACSLYLNIQFKPQPKSEVVGVGHLVQALYKSQPAVMLAI